MCKHIAYVIVEIPLAFPRPCLKCKRQR